VPTCPPRKFSVKSKVQSNFIFNTSEPITTHKDPHLLRCPRWIMKLLLFFTYWAAVPLFRRLAASPRTTGLSPRLFSFAAYGNQSGTHCEKSSYNTSCLSGGRITGIRYPKWSSPSLFTVGTSLIILTKVFFFPVA